MAYTSLYRKYRPSTFNTLFGQDHVVRCLVNQIVTGNIGHAYLFTGSRGTGKTSAAKIFARAINCLSPENGSPCGKCDVCLALSSPSSLDVVEIDAASNNGVDEIRELRENVKYPPVNGKFKVYIIDEVHMLSGSAFNALLKTLEEPPAHAVFILATTEVHKLPATILSRCMRFDFRLIADKELADNMARILAEEGREADSGAIRAIAEAGQGSVRDMLSAADMCLAYSTGRLTEADVLEVLGASDKSAVLSLIVKMLSGQTGEALVMGEDMLKNGRGVNMLVRDINAMLRDMLILKNNPKYDLMLGSDLTSTILATVANIESEALLGTLELFCRLDGELRYSVQPRILFDSTVARACMPRSDFSLNGLLNRVNALEKGGVAPAVVQTVVPTQPPVPEPQAKAEDKPSAMTMFGRVISGLRVKGMMALVAAASRMRSPKFDGEVLTVCCDDVADYRIISIPENKREIETCLKELWGSNIKFAIQEPKGSTDEADLNKIKILAESDVLKLL